MTREEVTFEIVEEYLHNPSKDNLAMPSEMYYAIINNYDRIPCSDNIKSPKFTIMKEGNDPKVSKLVVYPKIKKYRGQTKEEFYR